MKNISDTKIILGLILGLAILSLALGSCRTQKIRLKAPEKGQPAAKPKPDEIEEHSATGFPLQGRHRELDCDACHGDKEPKPNCNSCHNPPHDRNFRKKCEDCHTAGLPFSNVKFKHPAKDLSAFHQDVRCTACHENRQFLKAGRNCTTCHVDFHKGSQGRDCYVCHRKPNWNQTQFNHNQTGFPLMGTHRAIECGDCHRDLQSFRIVPRPTGCSSCHEAAYRSASFPHAAHGAGRECQECHLQDKFSYAHSPFWFNIQTGQHAGISCGTCHKSSANYREYSCHECHKGHTGDRTGRCLDCHPAGFPDRKAPAKIAGGMPR